MRSFRDLRVYQEGFRLAMDVFHVSRRFPDEEKYDLVRQVRRSSRSVCANTAEAWRRRRYPAALVAKLIDAEAEATETRVHLEFAQACGYLSGEAVARLDTRYDALLSRLATMRSRPARWTPRSLHPEGGDGVPRRAPRSRQPPASHDPDATARQAQRDGRGVPRAPRSSTSRGRPPSTPEEDRAS